jgi:predicted nuclease of predicted toxin-antitoxin system
MRLLADECVDGRVVAALREAGHDVAGVSELAPAADDRAVVALAAREGRALITQDKGISELAVREGRAAHGVILLRDVREDRPTVQRLLLELLATRTQGLMWTMTTIDRQRARLRLVPHLFREP